MSPRGPLCVYDVGMLSNPMHEQLLDWLMTPPAERRPRTQAELAAEFGYSPDTLKTWKRKPEFLEEWNRRYLAGIGSPERKSEIMETLHATAVDSDDPKHVQAAKTYFEIEGSLRPSASPVTVNVGKPASELSDDELEKLLAEKADDELAARRNKEAS